MYKCVYNFSQYSGDLEQVFFLLEERCGLLLCEEVTVRLLRGVAVKHVVLVKGAATRVHGEVFSELFPGKSLEGLVPVEGVAILVPVEGVAGLALRELVAGVMPGEVVAGVVAEEGSVGLTTMEGLASLVPGEVAAGLAPDELPEEGITCPVVGSTLTAHSRGSVGGTRVDGKR